MANKVFISFRYEDGNEYKEELEELFSDAVEVINCSEDTDRSDMSDETIKRYLYDKLKGTSVTIALITPKSYIHKRDSYGKVDDWIYDEIRYSLEDRENNRCNGLVAVYVPEVFDLIASKNKCSRCEKGCTTTSISDFNNLARKNMMNVYDEYKKHQCSGVYDSDYDSYCSLVSFEEFKDKFEHYISLADEKRKNTHKYDIKKDFNK